MFAGRYLWWMLIAMAIFLFFAMCFDYVTCATVATSGCARVAGTCGPIIVTMTGSMKPAGVYLAGSIMLAVTFVRIRYIGMSWLWSAFALILFIASAPFPLLLANAWTGQLKPETVLSNLPLSFLFLAVLGTYIGWSFEESTVKPLGNNRIRSFVIKFAAAYGALIVFAETPAFAAFPARLLGMRSLSADVAALQPKLYDALTFGAGNDTLGYAALAVVATGLATTLLPVGILRMPAWLSHPFMLPGSRR